MMKKFEQDECLLMAICQEDTCEQTKEEMEKNILTKKLIHKNRLSRNIGIIQCFQIPCFK